MRLLKIHVITRGNPDDVITFSSVPRFRDLVNITTSFESDEGEILERSVAVSRVAAAEYVTTLVNSLSVDSDPVGHLQITSCLFPAIMYDAARLSEWEVKNSIQEIVYATLMSTVQAE
jgi:hypothetical protein